MLGFKGVLVARVHLYGERLLCVYQLYEHREALKFLHMLPQDPGVGLKVFVERHAIILPVGDTALACRVGGELPAFGNFVKITGFFVHVPKPCAAPEVVLKGGGELFYFHLYASVYS